MLTRATPVVPFLTAATPTIAQSRARRLNFWYDQPAPATFGTPISARSSAGAGAGSGDAGEEAGGGGGAGSPPPPARPGGEGGPTGGRDAGGEARGGVAVGDGAADRAP